MRLAELIADCPEALTLHGEDQGEIAALSSDSRQVAPGTLFAALSGTLRQGAEFVPQAVANGASAILMAEAEYSLSLEGRGTAAQRQGEGETQQDLELVAPHPLPALRAVPPPSEGEEVAILTAANPRRALAHLAAKFYAPQPAHIVAVTGTDGKTSTVDFTRQLLEMVGVKAASLGTIGARSDSLKMTIEATHTTPDPITLHKQLQQLAQAGAQAVAMEASSHGLDQHRLDGVRLSAAAFTNLGRDHLDYHADVEEYFHAKRRLFADLLPEGAVAVVCAEDARAGEMTSLAETRGHRLVDYGRSAQVLRLEEARPVPEGLHLNLVLNGKKLPLFILPLMGGFQALNALAACGLAHGCGLPLEALLHQLPRLQGVRGRMELAGTTPQGGSIIVDYAHTPRALETALAALRPHATEKLHVVFGCGGDRDAGKRPLMGEVAARLADGVIVTDDNPRSESAAVIRAAVMQGCPAAQEIGDRAEAIARGIAQLGAGDVLLIAGKGHETTQTIGHEILPFDDAAVARAALAKQGGIA